MGGLRGEDLMSTFWLASWNLLCILKCLISHSSHTDYIRNGMLESCLLQMLQYTVVPNSMWNRMHYAKINILNIRILHCCHMASSHCSFNSARCILTVMIETKINIILFILIEWLISWQLGYGCMLSWINYCSQNYIWNLAYFFVLGEISLK